MPKGSLNVSLKGADDIFSTEESRQEQQPKALPTAPLLLWQRAGLISSTPRWTAPPRR